MNLEIWDTVDAHRREFIFQYARRKMESRIDAETWIKSKMESKRKEVIKEKTTTTSKQNKQKNQFWRNIFSAGAKTSSNEMARLIKTRKMEEKDWTRYPLGDRKQCRVTQRGTRPFHFSSPLLTASLVAQSHVLTLCVQSSRRKSRAFLASSGAPLEYAIGWNSAKC